MKLKHIIPVLSLILPWWVIYSKNPSQAVVIIVTIISGIALFCLLAGGFSGYVLWLKDRCRASYWASKYDWIHDSYWDCYDLEAERRIFKKHGYPSQDKILTHTLFWSSMGWGVSLFFIW